MAAKFFALALVALLAGQANAQLSATAGSTNVFSSLARFGKNSLARIAATSASNLGAMGNIANTVVNGGADIANAGVGVTTGIASTLNQLGFDGARNLASVGRDVAKIKGNVLDAAISIPKDAVQTGIEIGARGVNFVKSAAEKAVAFGADLSTNVLNTTSVVANRVTDAASNIVAANVDLATRAINATENVATRVGTAVDGAINSAANNMQGVVNNVASGITGGIDAAVQAGANGLNNLAANLAADADADANANAAVDANANINLSVTV